MKKLFIGKLSFSTSESSLRDLFASYEPRSVKIINDKMTGKSRGFGFIEIDDDQRAADAVSALDGTSLDGRTIAVSEARPQTDRDSSGSGGGFRSNFRDSSQSRRGNYRSGGNARY